MIVKEMNKKLPAFNADIGNEFDEKSIKLKKTNSRLTGTFIICLSVSYTHLTLPTTR